MAGRKSSVISGPPIRCTNCLTLFSPSEVVGFKAQRKRRPRGLCPRCTKTLKAARSHKKQENDAQ